MTPPVLPAAKRRPGRPPDIAKREAIIDAALEILAEVGYAGLTIDAVAQRAGSNRVLIYRVWDSKVALVRDALFGTAVHIVVPDDTGSLRGDLAPFVRQLVASMARPAYVKAVHALMTDLLADPAAFKEAYLRYVKPSVLGMAEILDRARARGEVTGAVDARLLINVISGTTTTLAQAMQASDERIAGIVLDVLVGGLIPIADNA